MVFVMPWTPRIVEGSKDIRGWKTVCNIHPILNNGPSLFETATLSKIPYEYRATHCNTHHWCCSRLASRTTYRWWWFGIIKNLILGIIGAVVGGWLFGLLGIKICGEWIGPIVTGTAGAVLLILLIGFSIKKK